MGYKHLTKEDRIQIQTLVDSHHFNNYIANMIGCSPCTISREINRSIMCGGVYKYSYANNLSVKKRKNANKLRTKVVIKNLELLSFLEDKLVGGWSPEQIVGRIKLEDLSFGSNSNSPFATQLQN
jgi:IS30 family transposase